MENPTYTIQELEAYLRQKKAGQVNREQEQKIQGDAFLQTIVIGLEKTMKKQNRVHHYATAKN